jgi:hypothetical protein
MSVPKMNRRTDENQRERKKEKTGSGEACDSDIQSSGNRGNNGISQLAVVIANLAHLLHAYTRQGGPLLRAALSGMPDVDPLKTKVWGLKRKTF